MLGFLLALFRKDPKAVIDIAKLAIEVLTVLSWAREEGDHYECYPVVDEAAARIADILERDTIGYDFKKLYRSLIDSHK